MPEDLALYAVLTPDVTGTLVLPRTKRAPEYDIRNLTRPEHSRLAYWVPSPESKDRRALSYVTLEDVIRGRMLDGTPFVGLKWDV